MPPEAAHPGVFPPEVRAQTTALACSLPAEQGLALARPSSDSLARQLSESGLVKSIAASTVRRWLRADEIRPWRFRMWLHILEPKAFLKRAKPILKLYEHAQDLLKRGIWVVCLDEKTSIQARKAEQGCKAPLPGKLGTLDPRYKRQGAVQLFAGLAVAEGKVFGQCQQHKRFVDFQKFIKEQLLPQAVRRKVKRLIIILDNGPTHAPKQLEKWLASELKQQELSLSVKVQWLPLRASWLDQIEIWFNKLQRKVLRSADFENLTALTGAIAQFMEYHNQAAKPIKWTYTAAKLERNLTPKLAANL